MSDIARIGIYEWLQKTMAKKGFPNYEVELSNSEKCDGYMGDITFIKVKCVGDSEEVEFNFIAKTGKDSKELRKQTPVHELYMNEIFFYKEVLPVFKRFQLEKNVKQTFNSVAEFVDEFMYEDIEFLVLENLKTAGFELYDRMKPLNLDHLKLTFREYGKYHALSFALREQYPELFKTLHMNMIGFFERHPKKQKLLEHIRLMLQDMYRLLETEPNAKESFKNIEQNVENILIDTTDPDDLHYVITHGDCWNNNFMYKYTDESKIKPKEVRFLDFQITEFASPVRDLSYLLYACASEKELLHTEELLHIYHRSLSEFLHQCGYDPEKIFSFETLLEHWRKYSAYGLVFGIFVLKFALCDSDEAPDMASITEKSSFEDALQFQVRDKSLYEQRALDCIFHYLGIIR